MRVWAPVISPRSDPRSGLVLGSRCCMLFTSVLGVVFRRGLGLEHARRVAIKKKRLQVPMPGVGARAFRQSAVYRKVPIQARSRSGRPDQHHRSALSSALWLSAVDTLLIKRSRRSLSALQTAWRKPSLSLSCPTHPHPLGASFPSYGLLSNLQQIRNSPIAR